MGLGQADRIADARDFVRPGCSHSILWGDILNRDCLHRLSCNSFFKKAGLTLLSVMCPLVGWAAPLGPAELCLCAETLSLSGLWPLRSVAGRETDDMLVLSFVGQTR